MPPTIVLIGPRQVGKSAIGKQLADRMGLPFVELSEIAPAYFAELGHQEEAARQAWHKGGVEAFLRYQAPFEAHAVERGLQEHQGSVVVLSAPQVAYPDDTLVERARKALAPCTVVLILPDPEIDTSVKLLDDRERVFYDGLDLNEHFVRHHSNHDLAKIRAYTKDQTPEQTTEAIIAQLDPDSKDVFLIGPIGTGKSTLGKLLSERLGLPQVSLDTIRWEYYKEIGFDQAEQDDIAKREGFLGVYHYWKRFEAYAVERALKEHHNCVMDFGGGHSVQENDVDFARVQAALAPYPNVVLILPSPDLDESVAILSERTTLKIAGIPLTRYYVAHPALRSLATHTLYTSGKTEAQIIDELSRAATE